MAADPEVQQVTEQYRLDQVAIQAAFLAQFVTLWPALSWTALDATAGAWIRSSMTLIRSFRQLSALRSERFVREVRRIQAPAAARLNPVPPITYLHGPDSFTDLVRDVRTHNQAALERDLRDIKDSETRRALSAPLRKLTEPLPDDSERADRGNAVVPRIDWTKADAATEHSLLVTGPGELKRQASMGRTEGQAKNRGLVVASGAASRQVLNGGRTATLTSVAADQQALGWARLTDGDPCAFCALLASRGPVYKSEASAGFKAHDFCACIPVAVFSKDAAWPGRSREYRDLYDKHISGKYPAKAPKHSGDDLLNAWRRLLEDRGREGEFPGYQRTPAAQTA